MSSTMSTKQQVQLEMQKLIADDKPKCFKEETICEHCDEYCEQNEKSKWCDNCELVTHYHKDAYPEFFIESGEKDSYGMCPTSGRYEQVDDDNWRQPYHYLVYNVQWAIDENDEVYHRKSVDVDEHWGDGDEYEASLEGQEDYDNRVYQKQGDCVYLDLCGLDKDGESYQIDNVDYWERISHKEYVAEKREEDEEEDVCCVGCNKRVCGLQEDDALCDDCSLSLCLEDLDICGETGRECDLRNPVKGCGETIQEDDDNIMIGNISFCKKCAGLDRSGLEEEE